MTLSSENLRIRTIMIQIIIMMIKRQVKVMLKIAMMTMMMIQICRGETSNSGRRAGQASAALTSPASTPLLFQTQGQHQPTKINDQSLCPTLNDQESTKLNAIASVLSSPSRQPEKQRFWKSEVCFFAFLLYLSMQCLDS